MTIHVTTRWYRAPEMILMEQSYTESVDIWALGCILADLSNMLETNAKNWIYRSPLFPGASCFPLSPELYNENR